MNQTLASLTLVLNRFDLAWQSGSAPDIREFLPDEQNESASLERRRLLIELVMVDLEFRWKSKGGQPALPGSERGVTLSARPVLEDYVALYRDLGPLADFPIELIGQEYRVRRDYGDRPDRESYLRRFPRQASLLEAEFDKFEAEEANQGTVAMPHSQMGSREADKSTLPLGAPQRPGRSATPQVRSKSPGADSSNGARLRAFGDYELLQEIARGGMGVVFKARQVRLNRMVAIKMILAGQFANQEEVQRFYAEAEAAANLDHPGIVPIYEIGEHDGQHYFSMAFVEGRSLADVVKEGPLPPRRAAELALKIAEAIAFAHGKGVIHRDLKPGNVLIDAAGQPKVTDFGLAKRVEGDDGLTATGQVLGTPSYMPPEQAAGRIKDVAQPADVYSLGAVLYCLLTGRPPFQAASIVETLQLVLHSEPVRPRALNPALPRDLETICLKCLQKSPDARYRSADTLADDLRRYLAGEPIVARPIGSIERVWRWCRRRPLAAALCVSLLVVALVSAGAIVINRQAQQARQQVELANQLAALQKDFDAKVDQPALGGDYLLAMDLLATELERRDPARGQEARQRFKRRYAEYITEMIHRPRFSDEEGESVRATLQQFARLDADLAANLSADLERNWRQWTEIFRLKPPFANVQEVFPPKSFRWSPDDWFVCQSRSAQAGCCF